MKIKEDFTKMQNATFGTWYKVIYHKYPSCYGYMNIKNDDCTLILKIENINGYGIGQLFFTNKDNRLLVLPWSAIVSMLPIENQEDNNKSDVIEIDHVEEVLNNFGIVVRNENGYRSINEIMQDIYSKFKRMRFTMDKEEFEITKNFILRTLLGIKLMNEFS